jgi:magnesium transporter
LPSDYPLNWYNSRDFPIRLVISVIRALVRSPHHGSSEQVDLETLNIVLEDKHALLWVDVHDPSPDELALLKRKFGFHDLALEDAMHSHMRPKIDQYDHSYFMVFYSLELNQRGALRSTELNLFAGENYLVAIHREPIKEIDEGLRRWEANQQNLGSGVGALLYALLDSLVDDYFVVADGIAERVARLEESVLQASEPKTMQTVFALKKQLLSLRRILGPERDTLNVLLREDVPILDRRTLIYLRDVYDHLVRITDTVDLHSDLLTSALDVHLSAISNRLNQIMKTLTSVTIILMSMALITGIYGMNFHVMPELSWEYGYAFALGLMASIGGGLFVFLRRKGWF